MDIDTGVILAAGEGRRLRPLTTNRPKPMLSAGTRPILAYVFDALLDAGVDDLHVVVGYNRGRVQNHFGPTYRDRPLTYHVQEKQLGTGHAVLQARDAISGDFVVVNGDELVRSGVVESVVDAHTADTIATLSVVESEQAAEFGAVRMQGETVTDLVEKPTVGEYRLLNRGVYALDPAIFDAIERTTEAGEVRLPDAIAAHIDTDARVRGVRSAEAWETATYPWDLLAVDTQILSQGRPPQPERDDGIYIHDAAAIHGNATLVAPVAVDADAVIESGVTVGPYTTVGQNATVESGAVVTDSIVESDVTVGANATVAESVLAQGSRVGPGVTIPGGPSDVRVDTTVHTGRPLGAVVADRAEIGGGTTVAPGTLVGPNALIAPGSTVRQNVEEGVEVRD
ncbi:MAG: sugar phosphate nucleotidyltransferase [Haloplanus sp.]